MKARIIAALQELNKEWSFSSCNKLTESECKDLNININCNRRPGGSGTPNAAASDDQTFNLRFKRQVGNSEDQAYSLEISFPTVDDEEVANDAGKTVKICSSISSLTSLPTVLISLSFRPLIVESPSWQGAVV